MFRLNGVFLPHSPLSTVYRRDSRHLKGNPVVLYFEDLQVGREFSSTSITVTESDIIAFASVYDTQPFHTDPIAAASTFFRGLAASGWHTAALTMKLMTGGTLPISGGIVGAGAEEIRWPNALRPGDTIHVECKITDARLLKSKPGFGIVQIEVNTINQHGNDVQVLFPKMLVPTRPAQSLD